MLLLFAALLAKLALVELCFLLLEVQRSRPARVAGRRGALLAWTAITIAAGTTATTAAATATTTATAISRRAAAAMEATGGAMSWRTAATAPLRCVGRWHQARETHREMTTVITYKEIEACMPKHVTKS